MSQDKTIAFAPVATLADFETLDHNEIIAGFMDYQKGDPEPGANRGRAYWHGWMNAARDHGEMPITSESTRLAKEYVSAWGRHE